MHVGKPNSLCPELKVNINDQVKKVEEDIYLGGMISEKGDNRKKIDSARKRNGHDLVYHVSPAGNKPGKALL